MTPNFTPDTIRAWNDPACASPPLLHLPPKPLIAPRQLFVDYRSNMFDSLRHHAMEGLQEVGLAPPALESIDVLFRPSVKGACFLLLCDFRYFYEFGVFEFGRSSVKYAFSSCQDDVGKTCDLRFAFSGEPVGQKKSVFCGFRYR